MKTEEIIQRRKAFEQHPYRCPVCGNKLGESDILWGVYWVNYKKDKKENISKCCGESVERRI